MTDRRRKQLTVLAIVIFLLFSAAACWFIGRPLLRFVSEPARFRAWVDGHGIWGRLVYVGMVALQVFIAIIPGEPLELVAGYAFGALEGTLLCLLGLVAGSAAVFVFVRRFGVKALEVFFSREKIESVKFLQNSRRLNLLTFVIFCIPGVPKDILAYGVGLTKMKLSVWLLITATARIPSVITSTLGGDALGMGKHLFAVIVFGATLLLSLAGVLVYRKLSASERAKSQAEEDAAPEASAAESPAAPAEDPAAAAPAADAESPEAPPTEKAPVPEAIAESPADSPTKGPESPETPPKDGAP